MPKHEIAVAAFTCLLVIIGNSCSDSVGERLYTDSGCPRCHGKNGEGGPEGPTLKGLRRTWKRENLLLFLKNPAGFRKNDPRLKSQSKHYRTKMPTFVMDEESRGLLADFLLAQ